MPTYEEAVQLVFTELPQELDEIPDLFFWLMRIYSIAQYDMNRPNTI